MSLCSSWRMLPGVSWHSLGERVGVNEFMFRKFPTHCGCRESYLMTGRHDLERWCSLCVTLQGESHVCTGSVSLIPCRSKSSALHLPGLLMEIKYSSKRLSISYCFLHITVLVVWGLWEMRGMFVEYLLCVRYFTRSFKETVVSFRHLCKVSVSSPFFFFQIKKWISEIFKYFAQSRQDSKSQIRALSRRSSAYIAIHLERNLAHTLRGNLDSWGAVLCVS